MASLLTQSSGYQVVLDQDAKLPCPAAFFSTNPDRPGYWWRLDYLHSAFATAAGATKDMWKWVTSVFCARLKQCPLANQCSDCVHLHHGIKTELNVADAVTFHAGHSQAVIAFLLDLPGTARITDAVNLAMKKIDEICERCTETIRHDDIAIQLCIQGMSGDHDDVTSLQVTFGGVVQGFTDYLASQARGTILLRMVASLWNQMAESQACELSTQMPGEMGDPVFLRDLVSFAAFAVPFERRRLRGHNKVCDMMMTLNHRLKRALTEFLSDRLETYVSEVYLAQYSGDKSLPCRVGGGKANQEGGRVRVDPEAVWSLSQSAKHAGTSLKQALMLKNDDAVNYRPLAGQKED